MRLVKMDAVDLAQFQFDFDMSWAALFLNADGTVYARYGSRSVEGPMATNSLEGLMSTMRRVLDAHAGYPENRNLFAAKRGPEPRHARPELFPSLAGRRGPVSRGNCIHCHNVHEAMHAAEIADSPGGSLGLRSVYKFPLPENIGLAVGPVSGTRVVAVRDGSAAERAGVARGDLIDILDGQAIYSIADIQFVLHHSDVDDELPVVLRRGDAESGSIERVEARLRLSGDWRTTDFTWRASLKGYPPSPGLYVGALERSERERAGIPEGSVALEVRGLFKPVVKRSGLLRGDVIVRYDGVTESLTAPEFEEYIRLKHFRSGSVLRLEVMRDGRRIDVDVTF